MLRSLTLATIVLTGLDHWTTYLCLRYPVDGWVVSEANPVADFLFSVAGLGPGLAIDSLVTLVAVLFLFTTQVFSRTSKIGVLAIITITTGYAVFNNLGAINRMGIAPWSGLL
jgi:hypothetical protein